MVPVTPHNNRLVQHRRHQNKVSSIAVLTAHAEHSAWCWNAAAGFWPLAVRCARNSVWPCEGDIHNLATAWCGHASMTGIILSRHWILFLTTTRRIHYREGALACRVGPQSSRPRPSAELPLGYLHVVCRPARRQATGPCWSRATRQVFGGCCMRTADAPAAKHCHPAAPPRISLGHDKATLSCR
jgi:hypothetical protein